MATVGEAIAATIKAQWNVGTGGTKPDPIQYIVELPDRNVNPTVVDAIFVWLPLNREFDPIDVAEVYRNVTYTLRIECHTKTDSARQLEIENEVDRILSTGTVITGATKQTVLGISDISNRAYSKEAKFISEVRMTVFTAMEVSATAYGTATATTLETDELTVNTSISGGPTADLGDMITTKITMSGTDIVSTSTYLYIKSGSSYLELDTPAGQSMFFNCGDIFTWRDKDDALDTVMSLDTATGILTLTKNDYNVNAALMLGSAYAAWVPCTFMVEQGGVGKIQFNAGLNIANIDGTDSGLPFELPIPAAKGSLKLYISGVRVDVVAANGTNYITRTRVVGGVFDGLTAIEDDATDYNSAQLATNTFTAVDASPYTQIFVFLNTTLADADGLKIQGVQLRCYYAT